MRARRSLRAVANRNLRALHTGADVVLCWHDVSGTDTDLFTFIGNMKCGEFITRNIVENYKSYNGNALGWLASLACLRS